MAAVHNDKFKIEALGQVYTVFVFKSPVLGNHYECNAGKSEKVSIFYSYNVENPPQWAENGTKVTDRSKALGTAIEQYEKEKKAGQV